MKDGQKKTNINLYLAVFLINLAAGLMSFIWTILQQGGLFSLAGDFNSQIVPFSMMTNDAIKSGNTGWAWSIDLGSGFLGGMHYYTLGSPSFWISMLFPSGRETHRLVSTGTILTAPSSTDFCITVSGLSPFVSAKYKVTPTDGS